MAKSIALAAVFMSAVIAAQSCVYAANSGAPVDITVSKNQIGMGESVLISVSLPSDTDANGAEVRIAYPQDMLSVNEVTEGGVMEGAYASSVKQDTGEVRAVAIWEDTIYGGGSVISVLLTAAESGSADITVDGRCTYTDLSSVTFSEEINIDIDQTYEDLAEGDQAIGETAPDADRANTENESTSDTEPPKSTEAPVQTQAAAERRTAFKDTDGHWAESEIEQLVSAGVIDGFDDGTFRPDETVTRAQFIKMLVSALGLDTDTAVKIFDDVDRSAWYSPYVTAAYSAGIAEGDGTYFYPESEITREEMSLMAARACGLSANSTAEFSDGDDISPWAEEAVAALTEKGMIQGFEDGTFRPKQPATRAQSAVILLRLIDQVI